MKVVTSSVLLCAAILSGCKSIGYTASEPSANPGAIKEAQEFFSQPEYSKYISVNDSGVIRYVVEVPSDHYWDKLKILEFSYEISCKYLRPLLEDGFVSIVNFQGRGGTFSEYDLYRCLQEDMDHL